jgi:uncharacterized protein (DUF1501 family)
VINRREFLKLGTQTGIAAATMPLWANTLSIKAFGQISSQYKAVVVVALNGGNDGNNLVVPINTGTYSQYASIRTNVALAQSSLIPLSGTHSSNLGDVGLHPSMKNVAKRFNQQQGIIVANVGPMVRKLTKSQLINNTSLQPELLLSHPAGQAQWQSSTTQAQPVTGWGGRIADISSTQSGSLPPVMTASGSALFTVGQSVQGIAVQAQGGGAIAIPSGLQMAIQDLARKDASSNNLLVAQAAKLRNSSMTEQALLSQAANYGTFPSINFSSSALGASMQMVARIINGRSVIGASRQLFFCAQGNYDHHQQLLTNQANCLTDLDTNLGAFMNALDEMSLTDQVLICTHSDFNRTMQSNATLGTDHGWGNHQIILSGSISGGRIVGSFPDLDLGGQDDLTTQGTWIPTTSVTQMTAGIGAWMGLTADQTAEVFPDLVNFEAGAIKL